MYKLDEKDLKIVDYIADHPGCSKEDVVKMMKEENSRITVLKRLDMLEKEGYIVPRKDKPNSQIYKIYIPANNLLVTETKELERFKKAFSEFLEILYKKREKLETLWLKIRKGRGGVLRLREYNKPSDLIVHIYSYLVVVYTAKSIVEWPKKGDKELLKQLYELVFTKLFEIESIVLNFYGRISNAQPSHINVLPQILNSSFLLNPPRFDRFVEVFERFEIIDEVTPVIDSLWELGSSFVSVIIKQYPVENQYPELENPEMFKDWKEFLRVWRINREKSPMQYVEVF